MYQKYGFNKTNRVIPSFAQGKSTVYTHGRWSSFRHFRPLGAVVVRRAEYETARLVSGNFKNLIIGLIATNNRS